MTHKWIIVEIKAKVVAAIIGQPHYFVARSFVDPFRRHARPCFQYGLCKGGNGCNG